MKVKFYISFLIVLALLTSACEDGVSSNIAVKEPEIGETSKSEGKAPTEESELYLPGPSFKVEGSKTTLAQTLVPVEPALPPEDKGNIPADKKAHFGEFEIGPGEPHILRNDLNINDANTEIGGEAKSILYFPVITDIHIIDTESPLRYCESDQSIPTAYRPQEIYSTQILNAMVRTLNDFSVDRPYDLLLSLGDATNGSQYNETRWFIDVLDGELVKPNSGDDYDLKEGILNDRHDEFLAHGLDKRVPWYTLMGNHDLLVVGVFPIKDLHREQALGTETVGATVAHDGAIIPRGSQIVADENRHLLGDKGFIEEFFNTTSEPSGHGLTAENKETGYANYTIEANDYVRIIALDSNCREAIISAAEGCIRNSQVDNFLVPELEKSLKEEKLTVVAMHHNLAHFDKDSEVSVETFKEIILAYPNVILLLTGHGHFNEVNPIQGNETHPGLYEIQTSSLADYPMQTRIIEFVYNGNGTILIYTTMIDLNSPEGSMSYIGRQLGLEDIQLGDFHAGPTTSHNYGISQGEASDRNTTLVVKIPVEIDSILSSANLPSNIESITTLAE